MIGPRPKEAFAKIGEDILAHTKGCASAPSFNTSDIVDGTSLLYMTRFDSEYWTGDVRAASISSNGVGKTEVVRREPARCAVAEYPHYDHL
ncbi:MAG: hypothetical protein Ct9H300mP16_04000 [Pseudomonadota bacterium]|nr:MAG: hypothetical protein Ct9H300mP16_04000 [Pseudomonadota bacterium]